MDWIWNHLPRLRRMLRRRGRSADEADDVIQELFLRVMLYCRSGREVRNPEQFLSRALLNLSSKQRRREHRDLYLEQPVDELAIADRQFAPEENSIADQSLERLHQALTALEPRT